MSCIHVEVFSIVAVFSSRKVKQNVFVHTYRDLIDEVFSQWQKYTP